MSLDAVRDAIDRWLEQGMIAEATAAALRAEADAHARSAGRRWAQYLLAITGAAVLVIAAGVFLRWAWPIMGAGLRTGLLAAAGAVLVIGGLRLESSERRAPVSYLMQAAGLAILLVAYAYSERAWTDASAGGIVIGIAALATPLLTAAARTGRNAVMPAVQTAFGYAFLYLFLDRATGLDADAIVWILDGVLVLAVVLLVARLRATRGEAEDAWALNAFIASVYAGLVLLGVTATGPLDAGQSSVFALDLWLAIATALTLWGLHGAPPGLRRSWYDRQLALCVLLAIPLGFWTMLGPLDASTPLASLAVAALGAAGLAYALWRETRIVIAASCVALLAAAFTYGTDRAGALGAVVALGLSGALFFWLSTRVGGATADP